MKKALFTLVMAIGSCTIAHADGILINSVNTAITQNFNGLANTGTTSSTLPVGLSFLETGSLANTTYAISNQGGSNGAYSFGATGSTDRAFGTFIQDGQGVSVGLEFTNNMTTAVTSVNITYRGEQYRFGGNANGDRLAFGYSTTATALDNLTTGSAFTQVTRGDITSPVIGTGTGVVPGTATGTIGLYLDGFTLNQGDSIFFRFLDVNVGGIDDSLAVDDFVLTANPTPEPETWAMMAIGVIALATLQFKRKRSVQTGSADSMAV